MSCKEKWFSRESAKEKEKEPIFCEEPTKRFSKEDAEIIKLAAIVAGLQ